MKEMTAGSLKIKIMDSRKAMGAEAARDISRAIAGIIQEKGVCNMIFAAAPSQNEVLAALVADSSIDWQKVNAFHMDEYLGLSQDAPQGFGNFLKRAIFSRVNMKSVYYIHSDAKDRKQECERYSALLRQYPVDIVCMGIGENGHIAFNDPHVADFRDEHLVKVVDLDEACRLQQVHDGCFAKLDDVPQYAITLTIPALVHCREAFCVVPAATKAQAVHDTVLGEISEHCPASILRRHDKAVLYLDPDSAKLI